MTPLTAIIPSYNSAATIRRTLDSLFRQEAGSGIDEVIVVDSSDDGRTREVLASYNEPRLKTVYLAKKTMPAEARNRGAEEASGDVLLFIDSDAYAAPDWAGQIRRAYQSGCRAGGGSIGLPEEQKFRPVPLAQLFLQFNDFLEKGNKELRSFTPSCNLFCEKKLFWEAGGFPLLRASEDVMFGMKVNETAPFWFLPEAKVYHIFRESFSSYLKNQLLLGKYILIYRRKLKPESFLWRGMLPLFLLPGIVFVKGLRISLKVMVSGYFFRYFLTLPFFLAGLMAWGAGFFQGIFNDAQA